MPPPLQGRRLATGNPGSATVYAWILSSYCLPQLSNNSKFQFHNLATLEIMFSVVMGNGNVT